MRNRKRENQASKIQTHLITNSKKLIQENRRVNRLIRIPLESTQKMVLLRPASVSHPIMVGTVETETEGIKTETEMMIEAEAEISEIETSKQTSEIEKEIETGTETASIVDQRVEGGAVIEIKISQASILMDRLENLLI